MTVLMMNIRVVRMIVGHRSMPMGVRMRLLPIPCGIVNVLMVFIVDMAMRVIQRFVRVRMLMPLSYS